MASIQYKSDWCCVCPALLLLLLGQVQLTPTSTPTRRWLSWRLALSKLNLKPNPFASLSISSRLFARFFRLLCRTSFSSSFKSLAKFFIVFQHRLFFVPFMGLYAARSCSCCCCRCSCCGNCICFSSTEEGSLYTSLCWCVHNLVPIAAKVICSAFSRQLSLGSVSLRPIARSGFSVKRVQIKFEDIPLTISAILQPNNSRF